MDKVTVLFFIEDYEKELSVVWGFHFCPLEILKDPHIDPQFVLPEWF